MSKAKVLVTAAYSAEGIRQLQDHFDVTYCNWMERGHSYTPEELIPMVKGFDILIVETDEITKSVVDAAENLKILGCCRGMRGNDGTIDVQALSDRKIPVLYAPGRNTDGVAEITIFLTMAIMKKVKPAVKWLYNNQWKEWLDFYLTFRTYELGGKKIGILGFGNIGKRVAELYQAFGCEVSAYDPYITDEEIYSSHNVKKVQLEELLRESDVITMHMNVSSENKGFFNAEKLSCMKRTAYLINVSRGALINHDDLYQALLSHQIAGAAADVFYREPATTINEPLLQLDNFFATPHIGGTTEDVIVKHSRMINDGISALLCGNTPEFILNPSVLKEVGCQNLV